MNDIGHPYAGETIHFGYRRTDVGLSAIAVGANGISAILLGSDRNGLRRRLAEALPGATLVDDDTAIGDTLDAVARFIERPLGRPGLALDLRGSPGELVVWDALRAIPAGETRSYGALAKGLGVAMTAQEVGAACAANRLAVVVPCHRVVKADGSISGYRWGVERKRQLLATEIAA